MGTNTETEQHTHECPHTLGCTLVQQVHEFGLLAPMVFWKPPRAALWIQPQTPLLACKHPSKLRDGFAKQLNIVRHSTVSSSLRDRSKAVGTNKDNLWKQGADA